jgi:multiple sugar transport system permease protein
MLDKLKDKTFTSTLILPWIITFCIFWLYPLIYAGYLSLTDYNTLSNTAVFIGLNNYKRIFTDPVFYKALTNTALFSFGTVPVTTSIAIFLAVMVNGRIGRFKEFLKTTYFIPSVTSLVVISLIFMNLYSQDGYINSMLKILNLPYPAKGWLQETGTSLLSVMIMDIWSAVGYYMVLFLAALQTIPNDLYASADLSGASAWQKFKMITFPMIRPTLLFVIIINTIKSFQIFIEIFVMTKGGPLNSTMTLVYMVYTNAFEKSDAMGYASALAYIVFIILLIFTIVQYKVLKIKN